MRVKRATDASLPNAPASRSPREGGGRLVLPGSRGPFVRFGDTSLPLLLGVEDFWYLVGPVVVTVGAARLRVGLEVLGHTRQVHPDPTRLTALTLDEEAVADVADLHGVGVHLPDVLLHLQDGAAVQGELPFLLNEPFVLYKLLQHLLGLLLPHLLAFELIDQVQDICGRREAAFGVDNEFQLEETAGTTFIY